MGQLAYADNNRNEALKWYRKAADLGDDEGQRNLGAMYYNGDGVPKDMVEGYMWLLLGVNKKDEAGRKRLEALGNELTAEQRAEGERRAREFQPTKSKFKPKKKK